MTLEEFLLNIHTSIYEYKNIMTDDHRLKEVLNKLKETGDIFVCLNMYDRHGFLNHRSLDALQELGRYLLMEEKIHTSMIKQMVYPIILCLLFGVQSFLFRSIGVGIFITPILILIGLVMIRKSINIDINKALCVYWTICLIEHNISIKEFLNIMNSLGFIHINSINSVHELVFKITGSSLTNVEILRSRYEDAMSAVLTKCEYSGDLLSKISTISIGFNMLYIMMKFARSFI
jgi:hypothetical protein